MITNKKVKVISASLGSDLVDDIGISISKIDFSAIDFSRCVVFPGFCDVHVHFREPGFFIKKRLLQEVWHRQEEDIPLFVLCQT